MKREAPYEEHTEHHADHQSNGTGGILQASQGQGTQMPAVPIFIL